MSQVAQEKIDDDSSDSTLGAPATLITTKTMRLVPCFYSNLK
jgi:hypothetical protein